MCKARHHPSTGLYTLVGVTRTGCTFPMAWQRMCHDSNCGMQVEGLEEVERAFVHVDYALRAEPEHKVTRFHPCLRHAV